MKRKLPKVNVTGRWRVKWRMAEGAKWQTASHSDASFTYLPSSFLMTSLSLHQWFCNVIARSVSYRYMSQSVSKSIYTTFCSTQMDSNSDMKLANLDLTKM